MCGLAGRFQPQGLPQDHSWHSTANALLAHRGPDGEGHYLDDRCELVHRRLALLDLSPTGLQPMPNEDGTIHVVFNGEIYNHPELRSELRGRGHEFRGTSDTEVLAHLYEEEGERMAARLRGMFAFAIYDSRRGRVLLARDRFGIKPLYCALHQGQWVFASEMKAILALGGFRPELDRQACYDFLGLRYIPEPATGFANIFALGKGTTVTLDARGARSATFAAVSVCPDPERSHTHCVEIAADLLERAVRHQSVADVPVAALLSGGIDSSLVVAAHARSMDSPIRTFNVAFPDKAEDETPVALAAANHYGTVHRTIRLDERAITPESVFGLLRHFDQPFADPSLVPTYWVSRAVRDQGIICTLTGDGGDEGFGGYPGFWQADRLVQLMALPPWVLAASGAIAGPLSGWTRDWVRQAGKAVRYAQAGRSNRSALLAGLANYMSEAEKEELVPPAARERLESVHRHFGGAGAKVSSLEELSCEMTRSHFALSLPSEMLRKVDMMSMRAGIEVRVPMLDEGLVDLGLTLPHRLKTDGRTGKLVLRGVAARWLPPVVVHHPKHGFNIPLSVMVGSDFHDAVHDLLASPGSRTAAFVQPWLVRQWLGHFRQGSQGDSGGRVSRGGLYQRVLILLALELWLREQGLSW